ncbi:MAG: hypothetical protein M3063_05085 [Actinomycetota bacterium]|nr:hypothetical protein [Actinomycetota bacterium]
MAVASAAVVTGAVLAGCGSASSTSTAVGCSTQGATSTATTKSYHYVLNVGPVQEMYAPGQAPPNARGETMFNGSMSMANGPAAQHVELHLCSAGSNRVVTNARPVMTLTDKTTGATQPLAMSTMQGLGQGQGDFHYGDNANVPVGHAFVLAVKVNGEQANLDFTRAGT